MRQYWSYILLGSSALLFFFTFFASDGPQRLESLKSEKAHQAEEKQKIVRRITKLKGDLIGMEENPRILERLAREELNLTRKQDKIVLFEK